MNKQLLFERSLTGLWLAIFVGLILFATSCRPSASITVKPNYEWLKEKQHSTKYARYIKWSCPNF